MTDREPDLDALLRSDAQAWRDQVDAARPDLGTTPVRRRSPSRHYVAGLIAAALVVGLAVLVVSLRPGDKATIRAGGSVSTEASGSSAIPDPLPSVSETSDPDAPVSAPAPGPGRVPEVAYCPAGGSGGSASGFGVSFAQGEKGSPTIEAAAAKFPPKDAQWAVVAQDDQAALLTYASHYLHLIRLPGGGWAVDSGGDCGGADATVQH
jgi:hypothetical protein